MAIFKCKMCGTEIDSGKQGTNNVCGKCGARYALKPVNKELADLYDRADALRRDCEFDSAESIYRDIISIDEKQADAYWGAVLCKYCVGCINDRDTHTRISICRGLSADSIKSDDDFLLAVEYGDNEKRSVYNSEADEIIRTQKEIFEIMSSEEPFDVFICYKEIDENYHRTQDSYIAESMYNLLDGRGLNVFYAPVTLMGENKMGIKYLTSIFAAVNSAKVMLAVGSKPEYFNAEWVKSEWSRFLELMKIDSSKILLPCFLEMKAGDLPNGLAQLQAEDITSRANEAKTANKVIDYLHFQNNSNPTFTALKELGYMALEKGEWQKASDYFEKVLDKYDATDAECYRGKFMIEHKVHKIEDLKDLRKSKADYYAFISYKSEEYDKAKALKKIFNDNAINCWLDKDNIPPGADWASEVVKAINSKKCLCVVLILTESSQRSPFVLSEVDEAKRSEKCIIPIRIGEFKLIESVRFRLDVNQIVDVNQIENVNRIDEDENDNGIPKVLRKVKYFTYAE